MKKLFALLLAAFIAVPAPFVNAATLTRGNARFVYLGLNANYTLATDVNPVSVPVQAGFTRLATNNTDPTDTTTDNKTVSFDLLDPTLSAVTITAAGKTVTYPQLAALIRQAALDRANAAGIQ